MYPRRLAGFFALVVAALLLAVAVSCALPWPATVERAEPAGGEPDAARQSVVATATATGQPPPSGDGTLIVGTYNVESGDAEAMVVGERLADLEGVDLWGLTEVTNEADARILEAAAEEGENSDFRRIVGQTGGADRMVILYDAERFTELEHAELANINIGGRVRAPLYAHFREDESGLEFLFMVNHLYSSDNSARHLQSELLNRWAATQTLPVVAVGDYNYRWHAEEGDTDHDRGYDELTEGETWVWVRPAQLVRTQCEALPSGSCRFNSVLDFVFTANEAQDWPAQSEIIVAEGDFPDDSTTSDHRPVLAWFQLPTNGPESPLSTPTGTPTSTPSPVPEATTPVPSATPGTGESGLRLGDLRIDGQVPRVESDEYIEIINEGPDLNVAGWRLQDDDGNVFLFPDHTMAQGSSCRVYTDEIHPEFCGFSFGSGEAIWSNAGDVVILLSPEGMEVERRCWGRGCQ